MTWCSYERSGPKGEPLFSVSTNLKAFDGQKIHLTDAKLNGVMLRDKRLTLRGNTAITELIVEAADDTVVILKVADIDGDAYLKEGDKGAFYAISDKNGASKFSIDTSPFGLELTHAGGRLAVFDDNNDVSLGKWQKGHSRIPILVHTDVTAVWARALSQTGGSSDVKGSGPPPPPPTVEAVSTDGTSRFFYIA